MTTKSLKFLLVLRILLLSLIGSLFPVIPSFAVPGDEHWDAQFGAPGTTNSIEAIAVNNGMLYVGGYGVPNTNATLCVWDGNQWSAFATFNNGASPASIYDATFVGNVLYVAGIFSSVNGT